MRADHFGNITYENPPFSALRRAPHPNEKSADAEIRSRDFWGKSLAGDKYARRPFASEEENNGALEVKDLLIVTGDKKDGLAPKVSYSVSKVYQKYTKAQRKPCWQHAGVGRSCEWRVWQQLMALHAELAKQWTITGPQHANSFCCLPGFHSLASRLLINSIWLGSARYNQDGSRLHQ